MGIDNIIRKLVKEKITDAKRIIKEVREKLIQLAKNFKCTDVLSESVCKEIKEFAAKIKSSSHDTCQFQHEEPDHCSGPPRCGCCHPRPPPTPRLPPLPVPAALQRLPPPGRHHHRPRVWRPSLRLLR